jgi:osmotically-inducible protein OsmY
MAASDLREQVVRELHFDQMIDASQIEVVSSTNGVVTLSGTVPSYLQKLEAERAAKRVKSVKAVANEIDVHVPSPIVHVDTDIAQRSIDSLRWRSGIPAERIRLTVANGWITLEGDVNFHFQKQEAERALSALNGVVGVSNKIRVVALAEPKPDDVKREIRDAFVRHARLEARNIDVSTEGSKVVLEGIVESWAEADEAEAAAWQAPGVTDVENHLRVS